MKLAEALAYLLPEPVTPAEVTVFPRPSANLPTRAVPAVLFLGRGTPSQLHVSHPTQTRLTGVPWTNGYPRALVPPGCPTAATRLLMPRAEPRSALRKVATRIIARIPGHIYPYFGRSFILATHRESNVVRAIRDAAPGASIGALVGNSRYPGRVTVFAFTEGRVAAVAKVVAQDEGQSRVASEGRTLRELERHDRLAGTVPRYLAAPGFHLGSVMITDAFSGHPAPLTLTVALRRWLTRCALPESMPALNAENIIALRQATSDDPVLGATVKLACSRLRRTRSVRTIVHGDFAPWNILMREDNPQVFDWEFGTTRGLPEWDAVHFVTQVGVTVDGWNSETLAQAVEKVLLRGSVHYEPTSYRAVATLVLAELAWRSSARRDESRAALIRRAANIVAAPLKHTGL